jgi:hypothetical protein
VIERSEITKESAGEEWRFAALGDRPRSLSRSNRVGDWPFTRYSFVTTPIRTCSLAAVPFTEDGEPEPDDG